MSRIKEHITGTRVLELQLSLVRPIESSTVKYGPDRPKQTIASVSNRVLRVCTNSVCMYVVLARYLSLVDRVTGIFWYLWEILAFCSSKHLIVITLV